MSNDFFVDDLLGGGDDNDDREKKEIKSTDDLFSGKQDDFFKGSSSGGGSSNYTPPPPPRKKQGGNRILVVLAAVIGSMLACTCICCLVTFGGPAAVIGVLLSNQVEATGTTSLPVEAPETMILDLRNTRSGDFTIRGGDTNRVQVDFTVSALGFTRGQAENAAESVEVTIQRNTGNTINLVVTDNTDFDTQSLDYVITVPRTIDSVLLNIDTDDVVIENLNADVTISNQDDFGSGAVTLTNVNGILDVTTNIGEILFTGQLALNGTHRFTSDSGDITLNIQQPMSFEYTASTNGALTCFGDERTAGTLRNRCSGALGDRTANLTVESDTGDVILRESR
jgi:hypothetical protein